jgi:hypothetical protein
MMKNNFRFSNEPTQRYANDLDQVERHRSQEQISSSCSAGAKDHAEQQGVRANCNAPQAALRSALSFRKIKAGMSLLLDGVPVVVDSRDKNGLILTSRNQRTSIFTTKIARALLATGRLSLLLERGKPHDRETP